MAAYYNELDSFAAEWLRNLISAGHIAPGDVDDRSITEVSADDLEGYGQCHFFAGIGLWSLALRWAGWPDDRPVWTGSCPCQPLSSAGLRKGHADQRHLWPAFHSLIAERGPATVLGEQVASKDGREWFSAVRADLEGLGYACGAADLCAAGIGAPHIRQRLFWVAYSGSQGPQEQRRGRHQPARLASANVASGLADADGGQPRQAGPIQPGGEHGLQPEGGGVEQLADAASSGSLPGTLGGICGGKKGARSRDGEPERRGADEKRPRLGSQHGSADMRPRPPHGFWRDADWLFCRDGKWRPVEPGTFPLVDGYPQRVGVLRAYGNAICPEVAAEFVSAVMEI